MPKKKKSVLSVIRYVQTETLVIQNHSADEYALAWTNVWPIAKAKSCMKYIVCVCWKLHNKRFSLRVKVLVWFLFLFLSSWMYIYLISVLSALFFNLLISQSLAYLCISFSAFTCISHFTKTWQWVFNLSLCL